MDSVLAEIAVRILIAAYAGLGVWLSIRIVSRAGFDWWWGIPPWVPTLFAIIPKIEIVGLLTAPVPLIFVYLFAFAEWPALIDTVKMGRRSRALTEVEFEESTLTPAEPTQGAATQLLGAGGSVIGRAAADRDGPIAWLLSGFDDDGRVVRLEMPIDMLAASPEGMVVGRNPQMAQLVVGDDSVSRRHARMHARGGKLMVEDLDSANGTMVEGQKLPPNKPVPVERGETIEFGAVKLTLSQI
jgi:hypothetical protein